MTENYGKSGKYMMTLYQIITKEFNIQIIY